MLRFLISALYTNSEIVKMTLVDRISFFVRNVSLLCILCLSDSGDLKSHKPQNCFDELPWICLSLWDTCLVSRLVNLRLQTLWYYIYIYTSIASRPWPKHHRSNLLTTANWTVFSALSDLPRQYLLNSFYFKCFLVTVKRHVSTRNNRWPPRLFGGTKRNNQLNVCKPLTPSSPCPMLNGV